MASLVAHFVVTYPVAKINGIPHQPLGPISISFDPEYEKRTNLQRSETASSLAAISYRFRVSQIVRNVAQKSWTHMPTIPSAVYRMTVRSI